MGFMDIQFHVAVENNAVLVIDRLAESPDDVDADDAVVPAPTRHGENFTLMIFALVIGLVFERQVFFPCIFGFVGQRFAHWVFSSRQAWPGSVFDDFLEFGDVRHGYDGVFNRLQPVDIVDPADAPHQPEPFLAEPKGKAEFDGFQEAVMESLLNAAELLITADCGGSNSSRQDARCVFTLPVINMPIDIILKELRIPGILINRFQIGEGEDPFLAIGNSPRIAVQPLFIDIVF